LRDQDEMAAQKTTGTNYAAANSLVSRLVKLNVLSEMTGYAQPALSLRALHRSLERHRAG
jgi:hypothetical protein